jgi:hypothetical protein
VDYLAQDLVFEDLPLNRPVGSVVPLTQSIDPLYVLSVKRTPYRFVLRYNDQYKAELQFGSGMLDITNDTINFDADVIASSEYKNTQVSVPIDPSDFLSSVTYGVAPANTEITITYSVGGGIESNVPSNSITQIQTIEFFNSTVGLSNAEQLVYRDIISSIAVNNPEPALGGRDKESVEEIRQKAMAFFNAQNRAVTSEDYVARCYAMPARYGSVSKVYVTRNLSLGIQEGEQFINYGVNENAVKIFVLGFNRDRKLVPLNDIVQQNLSKYLNEYRLLTDTIEIRPAQIINIQVKFSILVFRGFNLEEVSTRAISAIAEFFKIDRWQINQPINLSDLELEIAKVEGVRSVTDVKIEQVLGADYPGVYPYPDMDPVNKFIYPSYDPSIFELRYPERDIILVKAEQ